MSKTAGYKYPFNTAPSAAPVPLPITNIKDLTAQIAGQVAAELVDVIEGAGPDLQLIADEIAPVLVSAVAAGDKKLSKELEAQLVGIAEIHNIRVGAAKWRIIKSVSSTVIRAGSVFLQAAIGGGLGVLANVVKPATKVVTLLALCFALACGTPGTVSSPATSGLTEPVLERTDAYIAATADQIPADSKAAYLDARSKVTAAIAGGKRTDAVAVQPYINFICDIHDGYVLMDQTLSEDRRKDYTRSTSILRRMYAEAVGAKESLEGPKVEPLPSTPGPTVPTFPSAPVLNEGA